MQETTRTRVLLLGSTGSIGTQALEVIAANPDRFEVFSLLDAWTDVYAAPGTRSHGAAGGTYLLAGPRWEGAAPTGMTLLRAGTRMAWLIGRTQVKDAADLPRVHALQDGVSLERLGAAPAAAPATAPSVPSIDTAADKPLAKGDAPVERLRRMPTGEYFQRLAALMVDNPPQHPTGDFALDDGPELKSFYAAVLIDSGFGEFAIGAPESAADMLIDVPSLLVGHARSRSGGRRVAVATTTGGGAAMVVDSMAMASLDIVGPLPPAIAIDTVFSGAVREGSDRTADVRALLDFLASPATADAKRRQGMQPL